MRLPLAGLALASLVLGCAAPLAGVSATSDSKPSRPNQVATDPIETPADPEADHGPQNGSWIGAAGLSDLVMAGSSETMLGVWVDVPSKARQQVASSAVALVVDTSGSMGGVKIENARSAARALVDKLSNNDLVGLFSFSDDVQERMPLTVLSPSTRPSFTNAIAMLTPSGGTNLFEGLRSGERAVFAAPTTHPVKRIVLISDGQANVGPSSPDVLGALAARGAEHGIQVTAVGVGLDYDETTLNALAARSSGRLYHMAEPRDLTAILQQEMGLLQATAAIDAVVEIIPAPGVQLLGIEGVRSSAANGGFRVPLGSMFAGQHREMLVRVRVMADADGSHPLASVRLHFRDPSDGNVERVQETVARYEVTRDSSALSRRENARTKEIVATNEASTLAASAAEKAGKGDVDKAVLDLAKAEEKLLAQARGAKDDAERQRIAVNVTNISKARKATEAAAAAPPAAKPMAARAASLEANQAKMKADGL
jgi:Ca-activated chloride channel family protein